MAEYRTGNHWRVTIVDEGTQPFDATGHRPDARLRAVVMDGKVLTTDPELAEWICTLLNEAEAAPSPCQEETHSWQHFTAEQADSYWIRCTLQGPHGEHQDEQTGLTWMAPVASATAPGAPAHGTGR